MENWPDGQFGPNARAPEDEDEEEEAEVARRLHWCPVTACDDMELGPMPIAKVVMQIPIVAILAIGSPCHVCLRHTDRGGRGAV
jgi:hypothetical protein